MMLKFTLMKQIYYAFDPRDIPEVLEKRAADIYQRKLNVDHLGLEGIHEVTAQERYLPYSQLYRFYINDEKEEADITEPRVKEFVLAFFRYYHPEYLKDNLPEDVGEVNLLDCFEADRMPGYHDRRYAYNDLITMEEIRKGRPDKRKQKHGFPGLSFAKKYQDREGNGWYSYEEDKDQD